MRKTTLLIGSLAIFAVLLAANPAQAADSAIKFTGTLTAMSGVSLPATLTVTAGATTYTVNVTDSKTVIIRKFNGVSDLSEFMVGDTLEIKGTLSNDAVNTVTPKTIKDTSIQRAGGTFNGAIVTLDCANNKLTYKPDKRDQQTVYLSSGTKIIRGGEKIACKDLGVNERAKVIGLWRQASKRIDADRIIVSMQTLTGTITKVEMTNGGLPATITVLRKNNQTWTINVTAATKLFRKHMTAATIDEFLVGDQIEARGTAMVGNLLLAKIVRDNSLTVKFGNMNGTIKSINADAKTFVLTMGNKKKTAEVTVTTSSATKYIYNENVVSAKSVLRAACNDIILKTFTDLKVGDKLKVMGEYTAATKILAASRIYWRD